MAKSAESLEKKRVEFPGSAKKCKRVRNSLKRKNLNMVGSDEWRGRSSRMGIVGIHPAVFVRVARKGLRGYGTWKSAQGIDFKEVILARFLRNFG